MIIRESDIEILKKYSIDYSKDVDDLLSDIDTKILEIGYDDDEEYEINSQGRELERVYDRIYSDN